MSSHDPSSPYPHPAMARPRRRRRWLRYGLLAALLLIALGGAGIFYLLRTPPAHWKRYERFKATHTPDQIEQVARTLENRLYDLLEADLPPELRHGTTKAARPDQLDNTADGASDPEKIDPTMVRIDEICPLLLTRDEMTALVAARHEKWLESRGYVKPDEISDMMIDLEDGRLIASFKYDGRQFSQVFSAKFRLHFEDEGTAVIRLDSFDAGQLPLPSGEIAQYMRDKGGAAAEQAGAWLAKLDDLRFKPVLDDLPHRRRARIINYRIAQDQIELTLRVQDHRTYQEMNEQHKAVARSASISGE